MERVREAEKYWTPEVKGNGWVEAVVPEIAYWERMKLAGMELLLVSSFGNTNAQKSITWLPYGLINLSLCPCLRLT